MPITKKTKIKLKKGVALFFMFTILNQVLAPSIAYALTAGPTAPEATNFEPIDTTDMVNPLTGGFTYGMPLLEVPGPEGGYPLALSYHAGIQPNEEASWVGLGWSLNPGAIARNVNGYADDWSGAAGLTRSVWNGGHTETFTGGIGIGYGPASLNIGLSFSQDTYRGFGIGASIGAGFNFGSYGADGVYNSSPFTLGVSVGVDPYGAPYAGTDLNVQGGVLGTSGLKASGTLGISTNFKSIDASVNGGLQYSLLGASINSSNLKPGLSIGGGETTSAVNASADKVSTASHGFHFSIPLIVAPINVNLGYQYVRYWSDNPNPFAANGVLYNRTTLNTPNDLTNSDDDNYELFDPVNTNPVDNPDPLEQLGGTYPNFDNYSVTAQGLGGNIRPYIFSSVLYNANRINNSDHTSDIYGSALSSNASPNTKWQFRFINDFSNSYVQAHPWSTDQSYNFDGAPKYGNNDGTYGYNPTSNRLEGVNHIEYFTNDEIADPSPTSKAHQRGFIDCDATGFTRQTTANPVIKGVTSPSIGKQIGGFMITNSSGVTYHYALPAYSYNESQRVENEQAANIANYSSSISYKYTELTKTEAYAYTWYLTAITGPDYVSRGTSYGGAVGKIDIQHDWGYFVKFDYGKWTDDYKWRNPSEGENEDAASPGNTIYSMGRKQLFYLDAIETRSHTAIFEKEIRADGKSMTNHDEDATPYKPQAYYYPQNAPCGYLHPRATLRLNNIYLFQNDQLPQTLDAIRQNSTNYNHSFVYSGCTETVHYGQNVIDKYDITTSMVNNCLRKIAFNYDYTTSVGCPNSYDPDGTNTYIQNPSTAPPSPSSLLGKLTLLSVDFQGKGGALVTPPVQFQYDLDATDPNNQDNITISNFPNTQDNKIYPGTVFVQTVNKFKAGDILSFFLKGVKYYCTLLSPTDGTNTSFNAFFLNFPAKPTTFFAGTPLNNIAATRTKNPPYNKDFFDYWGYYKSDFGTGPVVYKSSYGLSSSGTNVFNLNNLDVIPLRNTSTISNISTDVWSLRKIISGVGAEISINYEGNTYNRSVLSTSKAVLIYHAKGVPVSGLPHTYTFPVNPMGQDLNTIYKSGDILHMVFMISVPFQLTNGFDCTMAKSTDSYSTPAVVQSVNAAANQINIQLDPQMESDMASGADFLDANISVNGQFYNGGGIRVKDVTVNDLNGNIKRTSYNYGIPGTAQSPTSTSGVTSYEPQIFDVNALTCLYQQIVMNNSGSLPDATHTALFSAYRKALYQDNSKMLSISREVPGPGVMYEYVTMTDSSILPDGSSVPIEGKTVFQYEVFKREMIGIHDYNDQEPTTASGAGPTVDLGPLHMTSVLSGKAKKDRSIKDYTSQIGNLKRLTTYDNLGNKLTEKINHYLHDDLEDSSFENLVANYEPRIGGTYNGVIYNNIGVISERYGNYRFLVRNADLSPGHSVFTGQGAVMLSDKETFPSILTGTTQIDYKNGTRMDRSNLAYDYYTGAVTKTLTTDSYGNRFINQITPAYAAYRFQGLIYPALGLKTHDDDLYADQHKQMLTQQASNYTFSVDGSNAIIGVVSASVQTWSNGGTNVLDPDGNVVTDNSQDNIWRMQKSLSWLASGTSANNLTPNASFIDYFTGSGNTNPAWKQTSEIIRYNVFSNALEAIDINYNHAATRMGYNNRKVLVTASPAMYNEIAYAGAEDNLLANGNFSNNISMGGGTVVTDSTKAHTGVNGLVVPGNSSGFTYTVPLTSLNSSPQNYSVSVWVKPTSGNFNLAQLNYMVGSGTIVTPPQTYTKVAAGWYLLEMTVPASVITGTGNLIVSCKNASSANLYFDDFRFQPTSAAASAYVYDKQSGELTYILDNNNLYVRFQYDAIGRLVRTYREVLGKPTVSISSAVSYNYGRNH